MSGYVEARLSSLYCFVRYIQARDMVCNAQARKESRNVHYSLQENLDCISTQTTIGTRPCGHKWDICRPGLINNDDLSSQFTIQPTLGG